MPNHCVLSRTEAAGRIGEALPGVGVSGRLRWYCETIKAMNGKEELHNLIDRLPASEIPAAERYLEFLLSREAPVDPEMLKRVDAARAEASAGIPHEEILREYGL
jgi:hypothetical protein